MFVSLTPEDAEFRGYVEAYVRDLNIAWPVGLEAGGTISALGVTHLPSTFVIDREGQIAWHSGLGGNLDRAIQQALR